MTTTTALRRTRSDRFADWAVIGLVVVALVAGWLVKSSTENAMQAASSDVASFDYPKGWLVDQSDGLSAQDARLGSASGVATTFSVSAEALDGDPSLNALSTRRTIKLSQDLDGFSMLGTKPDNINGESAVTLSYAYVIVPEAGTAGSARLPVVVQATDTLVKHNGQLYVVHFNSDANSFESLAALRAKMISSVKLP